MGAGRAEAADWAPGVSTVAFGGVDSGCWAFPAARLLWAKAWLASPYKYAPSCQQPCVVNSQYDEACSARILMVQRYARLRCRA